MTKLELEKIAVEVRKGIITGVHSAKSGHPGGSLSAAEIFTYLYFVEMNVDPKNPKDPNRDRFVLSKGHVAPGLYATLAQKGYFPVEELEGLRHIGSMLQGHPDMKHIPGIDMSSGSLDRDFPQQLVWHWLQKWTVKITVYIHWLVMARSRRDRFGRQLCLPEHASWITLCYL